MTLVVLGAQMWCGDHATDPLCGDGGADWAIAPVGTAPTVADTKWTPKQNAVLAAPGAAPDADDAAKRAGYRYSCACLKNCQCTSSSCWCATAADRTVVGSDPASNLKQLAAASTIAPSKAKTCACTCGGIFGA